MFTPTPTEFDKKAECGLDFIVQHYGKRGQDRIDSNTLDIMDPDECALTQASGMDYGSAVSLRNLSLQDEKALGFFHDLPSDMEATDENITAHYALLTRAFRLALHRRRHNEMARLAKDGTVESLGLKIAA